VCFVQIALNRGNSWAPKVVLLQCDSLKCKKRNYILDSGWGSLRLSCQLSLGGYPKVTSQLTLRGFPKVPHPTAKSDSPHKSYPCLRGGFLCKSGSTSWVGLTDSDPRGSPNPSGTAVSAPRHSFHNGSGGNDSVGYCLFGAICSSVTSGVYPANLLSMPPSTSLVADPPRRKIARLHFPSFLPLFCRVAEAIIQFPRWVSSIAGSGKIGVWGKRPSFNWCLPC